MNIYLVRHAQSKRNARLMSKVDSELTEDGKEQARRLGIYFNGLKINKIYCSRMKRARDTLKEIKIYLPKVPVAYTNRLNEHSIGVYEKKGYDNWFDYKNDAKKLGVSFYEFRPKGGDSLVDTYKRAGRFYKELLKKHRSGNILIVGHGLFLLNLIFNALNLEVSEERYYRLSNASVSQLTIEKGNVKEFHINDFKHLIAGGIKKDDRKSLNLGVN
ncbi:MAG: histidine phosphatase family protein [Promethearchaeota archaeon]